MVIHKTYTSPPIVIRHVAISKLRVDKYFLKIIIKMIRSLSTKSSTTDPCSKSGYFTRDCSNMYIRRCGRFIHVGKVPNQPPWRNTRFNRVQSGNLIVHPDLTRFDPILIFTWILSVYCQLIQQDNHLIPFGFLFHQPQYICFLAFLFKRF